MKKLLSIVLALTMIFALSVPVSAAPKVPEVNPLPGAREAVILNAGFHCSAEGGNGRVWVKAYDDKFEADKALKKAGIGGVLEDLIYLDDNCWLLANDTDYVCPKCGSTVWVSYSNKSGVPDGKNIQLTHGVLSNYCEIEKTWKDKDGNTLEEAPEGVEAIFDVYKYVAVCAHTDHDEGDVCNRGEEVLKGLIPNVRYSLRPGTYVVAEREKQGYEKQPDEVITISYNQSATVSFVNEPKRTVVKTTEIFLKKYLKQGDEIVEWNDGHPYWSDNQYIYFDLYSSNEAGKQLDFIGSTQVDFDLDRGWGVGFAELTIDAWYLVVERIDFDAAAAVPYADMDRLNSYGDPLPTVHFQAKEDAESLDIDFNPGDVTDTGIKTKRNVIVSTDKDEDLTSESGYLEAFDDSVMWEYNGLTPVAPFWKQYMINYNGGDNFFKTLDGIWLDDEGEIRPQFIWNTGDFTNPILAHSGSVEILTKKFTVLDTLTDENYDELADGAEVPFYITGDNAFIVFVNGVYVGKSDAILQVDSNITLGNYMDYIGDLRQDYLNAIPMDTWAKVYQFDIRDALIAGADNEITIVAINAGDTWNGENWTQNYADKPMSNPAGFIFGCEVFSISEKYRFVNELPEERDPAGIVTVIAEVELYNEVENWKPIYDGVDSDTWVTWLGNTEGDTWNNGHTYVKIDVAEATAGVTFTIADSSKGADPNAPIDYTYDVRIEDNELIITFPENLVDIGTVRAKVFAEVPEQTPPGQMAEWNGQGEFRISMPDDADYEDVVYLAFHIGGSITWDTGEWEKCCDGEPAVCTMCEIPNLTAKIFKTVEVEGEPELVLVDEKDLTASLDGLMVSFESLDLGIYTIKLFNGTEVLAEKEVTVETDGQTVYANFDEISLRCDCETVVIKDPAHTHD